MGLTIITSTKKTLDIIKNQISNLIGDIIDIRGYYLNGNIEEDIYDDLVLVTSRSIYNDACKYIHPDASVLTARRSINYHEINDLFSIPEGSDVLLVNDLEDTVIETILLLKTLGIDYINFYPYYPGINDYVKCKIAVTPGEPNLVPKGVEQILDIKTRTIDFTTMVEILIKFNLMNEKANILSAKYVLDIINLIKKRKNILMNQKKESVQLETIINTVSDGIIACDEKNKITVFNPVAEGIFNVTRNEVSKEIPSQIESVLFSGETEHDEFIKIGEKEFIINKSEMKFKDEYKGEVFTLKDVTEIMRLEEELRRKLILSEHFAKYTLEDIEGKSDVIKSTKNKAFKIAKSNSPILIQGESGTGKELFAQAIHNASDRMRGPFVAINFAALPDSLLDSELFGYEEGAFTGAKKGGMRGLFEQAHGGTIFLDEIGDAPINFQIRLLRVIQEKQVRRIGANKVIPIDVRIISATNRDLKKLIDLGKFREDLYYRLNVLPITIPSLRERADDIMHLASSFYKFFLPKANLKPSEYFSIIEKAMIKYRWSGNIRELRNVVEFLINIRSDSKPSMTDLPDEFNNVNPIDYMDDCIEIKVLKIILGSNQKNLPIGRRSLSKMLNMPESRVRSIIDKLFEEGLISIYKGRRGIELTERGYSRIEI